MADPPHSCCVGKMQFGEEESCKLHILFSLGSFKMAAAHRVLVTLCRQERRLPAPKDFKSSV